MPRGAERYLLRGGGPPVGSSEVELAAELAIEVVVLWGGDVLGVSHFATPGTVFVGGGCDGEVALPAELLGAARRCVAVSSRGDVCAVLPGGVRGWFTLPDGSTRPFDERAPAIEREASTPSERLLPLGVGYRAHLCFATLEIQVATVRPGRACRRTLGIDGPVLAALGLSALTAASLMAAFARLAPAPGLNQHELAEVAKLRELRSYLTASEERAAEERAAEPRADRADDARRVPAPLRQLAPLDVAPGNADGETDPVEAEPLLGLDAAPEPARDPLERRAQLGEARRFGIVGMLDWGVELERVKLQREMSGEEVALMKRLFNPESVPLYELGGGLELSSTGIGSGGRADVIALRAVRTVGEGNGEGLERSPGSSSLPERHTALAPVSRKEESIVSDPLAAASVRRAVYGVRSALRACYADAPSGASTISAMVRFVVRSDGQLEQVHAAVAALPGGVSRCIERVFLGLSVPNPVSRPVHVAYRVVMDS